MATLPIRTSAFFSLVSNTTLIDPPQTESAEGGNNPDLGIFQESLKLLAAVYLKWIPIKAIIQDVLINICQLASPRDGGLELIRELYHAFSILYSQHTFSSLIQLIQNKLLPVFVQTQEESRQLELKRIQFFFELGRRDLLLLSPAALLHLPETPHQSDLLRAAALSYYYAARAIQYLIYSIDDDSLLARLEKHEREGSIAKVFNQYNLQNARILKNNPALSHQRRCDLSNAFRKLILDFLRANREFTSFYADMQDCDLVKVYLPLLMSDGIFKICHADMGISQSFPFIEKNRSIFDDFLAKNEEIETWVIEKSKKLQETCALLQDFALFFHLGNLDKIRELPDHYISTAQFSQLLFKEIDTFKKQLKEPDMIKKVGELFRSDPSVLKQRGDFVFYERFYAETHSLYQNAILGPLETCRELSSHLSLPPPSSPLQPMVKSKQKKQAPSPLPEKTPFQPSEPLPASPVSTTSAASTSMSKEPAFSFVDTLTFLRKELHCCSKPLMQVGKALGTQAALKNSQDHLEDLLSETARFERLLKNPLTKEELFSFIVNLINHGTLLTEQLLVAQLRKTRAFNDEKEMKQANTHQLPLLLQRCRFGHFPLAQKARTAILHTNLGEILSRDLVSLAEKRPKAPLSSAEGFLAAAYSWMAAEESPSPEFLIRAALDYLAEILLACQQLRIHIRTNDSAVGAKWIEEQTQTERMIGNLKRSLLKEAEKISLIPHAQRPNPFSETLDNIQTQFAHFLSQPALPLEIQRGFENLQNNYLCRLKTELSFQATLPPKELRLHYVHVVLLCQYMAEEFLYQRLTQQQIDVDPKEIDHDLVQLVKQLGYSLSDFPENVQEFLMSGKETRGLMRYRFNYQQGGALQENIHNVSRLAETQAFGEEQDKKFTLVEGKKGSIQAMMKHAADQVSSLQKLIHFLAAPA